MTKTGLPWSWGIGNSNGLFRQTVTYQSRRLGALNSLYRLKCGRSSCEWGLTGPFFPGLGDPGALLWRVRVGTGQKGRVGPGTEPAARVGLRCLEECVEGGFQLRGFLAQVTDIVTTGFALRIPRQSFLPGL